METARDLPPDDAAPLPTWLRVMDIVGPLALLLGVLVLVFGGFRVRYDALGVSAQSPWRPLLAGLATVAIRHALVRRPHLPARLWQGWTRLRADPAVREAVAALAAIRVPVLVAGFFAVVILGYPPAHKPTLRATPNEVINLPMRWDAGWYLGIAIEGYAYDPEQVGQQRIAFFPAYPLLMRTAAALIGARQPAVPGHADPAALERHVNERTIIGGWLVSIAAGTWALVYLFRFARDTLGPSSAAGSVWLLSAYPFAYFFGALYTEALYLLGAIAAIHHFRRHEYLPAAAWGLLVGLTRPNGCFLSVPLGLMALQASWLPRTLAAGDPEPRPGWAAFARSLTVAAMPGLGMVAFSAWLWTLTGHPIAWMRAHAAWGRTFQSVDSLIVDRLQTLVDPGLYFYLTTQPIEALYVVSVIGCLAAAWPVGRRLGLGYAVLILITILPPLFAGGFLSMGRITSTLFPVFVYLGWRLSASASWRVVAAWATLQGMLAAAFFTWRHVF